MCYDFKTCLFKTQRLANPDGCYRRVYDFIKLFTILIVGIENNSLLRQKVIIK